MELSRIQRAILNNDNVSDQSMHDYMQSRVMMHLGIVSENTQSLRWDPTTKVQYPSQKFSYLDRATSMCSGKNNFQSTPWNPLHSVCKKPGCVLTISCGI